LDRKLSAGQIVAAFESFSAACKPLLLIKPLSISTKAAKNYRRSLDFAALRSG